MDGLYLCDPDKNTECTKEFCHRNMGPCEYTRKKEYAVEETEQNESKVD